MEYNIEISTENIRNLGIDNQNLITVYHYSRAMKKNLLEDMITDLAYNLKPDSTYYYCLHFSQASTRNGKGVRYSLKADISSEHSGIENIRHLKSSNIIALLDDELISYVNCYNQEPSMLLCSPAWHQVINAKFTSEFLNSSIEGTRYPESYKGIPIKESPAIDTFKFY